MHFFSRITAALAAVVLALPAMAAVTPYLNEADFQAALTAGSYTESFSGLTDPPPSVYSGGGFGFEASAPTSSLFTFGNELSTNDTDAPIVIEFTTGNVRGVGGNFFLTNIQGGFEGFFDLVIMLSNGDTFDWSSSSASAFVGFVSDDVITSITLFPYDWTGTQGQTGLYATVDNLTIGGVTQIPEPATLTLLGAALAGLMIRRRRTV